MKGDNCTNHPDRIAVGYYSDKKTFGKNGCKKCMEATKNAKYTQWELYGVDDR